MRPVFLMQPGLTQWELVDVRDVRDVRGRLPAHVCSQPRRSPLRPLISGSSLGDKPVAAPVEPTGPRPTSTTIRTENRKQQ